MKKQELLIKSREAMLAAVQIYNKKSLNSAEVHRLFDMTGSLFDCLSYFKLY